MATSTPGTRRRQRQERLREKLRENPFLTDEELAAMFRVSVQTVRLDRLALGIPDLRARTQAVARQAYARVRSIGRGEIVGEVVDLDLGHGGISLLETTEAMAYTRTRIVRGHHLYAQAESLALAVLDAPAARVGVVNAKFRRPVVVGERLVAKATVLRNPEPGHHVVLVTIRSGQEPVFRGKFMALTGAVEAET
ncbi:MAG: transcription factor FapR [Clostridia bacterium]|nr:transcription factor FapR [Clostridia bacterium]